MIILISILYILFSVLCAPIAFADEHVARPLVWAHRGGRKWASENTMAAFRKSLTAHVDGIELDIHRLKSGELVVIHDENLKRTTNGNGLIGEKCLDDLQQLDAGSWYSPEFKDERVPLLSDVLKLVDGRVLLNIEIKNIPINYPHIEDDLLKLLAQYKYTDKIVISSFDHQVLQKLHKKAPQYKLALLDVGILANIDKYAESVGASSWNPDFDYIRQDSIPYAHQAGLKVNVWTVNGKENWHKAISMGVDGIITDDPAGLIKLLDEEYKH